MSEIKSIARLISEEGRFVGTTSGVSMEPLFSDRRDTIIVVKTDKRLKKYDIPLYKRGDNYILHRVVRVLPDSYVICGDNCEELEYGVTDSDILGVLVAFYRKDKYYTVESSIYRIYSFLIVNTFTLRVFIKKVKRKISYMLKRLHIKR